MGNPRGKSSCIIRLIWPWVTFKCWLAVNANLILKASPHKEGVFGYILLLNTNRKSHMWSGMEASHLTLSDLEGSQSRSLILWWQPAYHLINNYFWRGGWLSFQSGWLTNNDRMVIRLPWCCLNNDLGKSSYMRYTVCKFFKGYL